MRTDGFLGFPDFEDQKRLLPIDTGLLNGDPFRPKSSKGKRQDPFL